MLANGNWDDPVNGHNKGDPKGWQAYAYDFDHAEGGKILAARGGTVYDLDESSSKNGFNPATPCNPGVGNYVVIAHPDGTYGVYWHMKHNGVLVGVGDSVKQGDEIALSGNTGTRAGRTCTSTRASGGTSTTRAATSPSQRAFPCSSKTRTIRTGGPKVGDALATNNS